jgi:hypothetical protein
MSISTMLDRIIQRRITFKEQILAVFGSEYINLLSTFKVLDNGLYMEQRKQEFRLEI